MGPRPGKKDMNPKLVFDDLFQLYPNRQKLKAPKVIDWMRLMKFIPVVYQDYHQCLIESYKEIVNIYEISKKKNSKCSGRIRCRRDILGLCFPQT